MKLKKVQRTLLAIALSCAMVVTPVMAAPEDEEVERLQNEKANAEAEKNDLQSQLNTLMATISDLELQLVEKGQEITQAEIDLAEAEEQEQEQYEALLLRIKCMYEEGESTVVDSVLSAGSISEALTKAEYVQKIHTYDREQLQIYQNTVKEVKERKAQLEKDKEALQEKETEYQEKSAQVMSMIEEKSADIANLDGMLQEAVRIAQEAEAARLEAARLEAERLEQLNRPSNGGGSSSGGGYQEPSYDVVTGNAIVDRAYGWVGRAEYVWGACSPGAFDCSGFVAYCLTGVYSRLGSTHTFLTWSRVSDPQPGDVCVNVQHCGIYIGNGQMIHAATEGVGVIVGPVQSGMVYVRY